MFIFAAAPPVSALKRSGASFWGLTVYPAATMTPIMSGRLKVRRLIKEDLIRRLKMSILF